MKVPKNKVCEKQDKAAGQDLAKEVALKRLKRKNAAPVAFVEIGEVMDRHVRLDASGSRDDDGFVEHYTYQLFDADTGEILAGPVTLREPFAILTAGQALPGNLLAKVSIEDDLQATDSAEDSLSLGEVVAACENSFFSCSANSIFTNLRCTPKSSNTSFTVQDLLDATSDCSLPIDGSTKLEIFAAGGAGGRGANFWPHKGGAGGKGGVGGLSTTIDKIEAMLDSPTAQLCYLLGSRGGHSGSASGAGGASSAFGPCDPSDYLVIGGGGGGGGRALISDGVAEEMAALPFRPRAQADLVDLFYRSMTR